MSHRTLAEHDVYAFVDEVLIGDAQHELEVSDRDGIFIEVASRIGDAALVDPASSDRAFAALGLSPARRSAWPVVNAGTERPKTLVPLDSVAALHSISTSEQRIADACAQLGTTGLFPFVCADRASFDARQFPANAGFLEDSASGTAAIALASAYGVVYPAAGDDGERTILVRQGFAMGRPSQLFVRWRSDGSLALGGRVRVQ